MPPYGAPDPRRYCRFDRRRRLLLVRFEKQLIGEAVACSPSASAMGLGAGGSRRQRIASRSPTADRPRNERSMIPEQSSKMSCDASREHLQVIGLVGLDGLDAALPPGRRARTGDL